MAGTMLVPRLSTGPHGCLPASQGYGMASRRASQGQASEEPHSGLSLGEVALKDAGHAGAAGGDLTAYFRSFVGGSLKLRASRRRWTVDDGDGDGASPALDTLPPPPPCSLRGDDHTAAQAKGGGGGGCGSGHSPAVVCRGLGAAGNRRGEPTLARSSADGACFADRQLRLQADG